MRFGTLLIFALALLFRLPVLWHPEISSDSAIVGLQGLHMLRGEWARFIWSTSYQSSFDPLVAGLFAKLFGVRPLAIVLGPALEQCAIAVVMYRLVRRHVSDGAAFVACLPLLFPLQPAANALSFTGTRSMAGLVALTGAALLDADVAAPGAALLVLSTGLDLYTVEMLPALALLGKRWKPMLLGAAPAALAVVAWHTGEHTAVLAPDPGRSARNLKLLAICLPDAIGTLWREPRARPEGLLASLRASGEPFHVSRAGRYLVVEPR